MIFKQFQNENRGLSYLEEPKEITSGLSGVDFVGIFDNTAFKGVAATLYTHLMTNLPLAKKTLITTSSSYVPDMLRLYMQKVSIDRLAYNPQDLTTKWIPYFVQKGFDADITKLFFEKFYKLNSDGYIPRTIWFPDKQSSLPSTEDISAMKVKEYSGLSTGAMIGIGAAALAGIGFLIYAMKK